MASLEEDHPGDDRRARRSGCRPTTVRRSASSMSASRCEQQFDGGQRQRVAVDPLGVVGVELAGRSRPPRWRCRPPRSPAATGRAHVRRQACGEDRADVRRQLLSSAGRGGSAWMWRSLMRTTPACRETWKPTLWSAPTTNSVEPPPMSITTVGSGPRWASAHRAEERQLGLLSPAQDACVEPEVVAHAGGELLAVGGVPDGRGEHRDVVPALRVGRSPGGTPTASRRPAPSPPPRAARRRPHPHPGGSPLSALKAPAARSSSRVPRRRPAGGSSSCRCPPRRRASPDPKGAGGLHSSRADPARACAEWRPRSRLRRGEAPRGWRSLLQRKYRRGVEQSGSSSGS